MIEIRDISLAFGPRKLFDGITAVINRSDKIGLAGSNGAGKSTLLKILAGEAEADSGRIVRPKYASVGYLAQDISSISGRPLYEEAESAFESIVDVRTQLEEAEGLLRTLPDGSPEYLQTIEDIGAMEIKLEDMDAYRLRSKVETVLHGLGFQPGDMGRACSEFSGGWRMRIALAKLLLRGPSLLMLDEPTNHLDIESITWLEDYLKAYRGAVVIVSHDRSFLDLLTTRTFHLGAGRLEAYAGNYSYYERESAARRESLERAAASQAREIAKTERFIERFRSKSSKAAQVQSRIKALDKVERIEVERVQGGISFSFPEPRRCGQVVMELENVCKSYGENSVLRGVSLKIERGDRIAVVGANGAGKTTLARIMAGAMACDSGRVELGYNVEMSYFAQHQASELNPENTVLEEAESAAPRGEKFRARGLLGSFLFSGDDALKRVSVLSGGEKNRLALAKMLLRSFNFLILDEPTNHLDINSKKVLQDALKSYSGTFLIVSHDRDFLDPVVTKVVEIGRKGVREFPGNISDYVEKIRSEGVFDSPEKSARRASQGAISHRERKAQASARNREMGRLRRLIAKIEEDISKGDAECAELEALMADGGFFRDVEKSRDILARHAELKAASERLYADWEKASEELAGLEGGE